jgi:hypothetical protein
MTMSKEEPYQSHGFFVYMFHHDDDRSGYVPVVPEGKSDLDSGLRAAFTEAGWEGDGTIVQVLVPPYFTPECRQITLNWFPIYFVKQENNGTNWIASKYELGFAGERPWKHQS